MVCCNVQCQAMRAAASALQEEHNALLQHYVLLRKAVEIQTTNSSDLNRILCDYSQAHPAGTAQGAATDDQLPKKSAAEHTSVRSDGGSKGEVYASCEGEIRFDPSDGQAKCFDKL